MRLGEQDLAGWAELRSWQDDDHLGVEASTSDVAAARLPLLERCLVDQPITLPTGAAFMTEDVAHQLESLDPGVLAGLVRQALRAGALEIAGWECHPIYSGLGAAIATSAVYRLTGSARTPTELTPWSLVLKVLHRPTSVLDATAKPATGWDREVQTYRSGLLKELPPGLAAPRCFGIEERTNDIWLWLEDVAEVPGNGWPLARFGVAARHLGRLNGRYLVDRAPPAYSWLSRSVLRQRAQRNAPFWTGPEPTGDRDLLTRLFPADLAEKARHLWDERDHLLDVIDGLPQTLVHGDADRRNLFARRGPDGDETVAIDWAYTGIAALGEELVNLVAASALWYQVGAGDLVPLTGLCLDGYLAGLADAGWRGDERLPRVGFAVGTALRYGPFGPFTVLLQHPELSDNFTRAIGHTPVEFADRLAAVQRFAYDYLDATRASIPQTG